ncbi:snf2 family helicase [Trichoderma arundinaceum]|uniref:Snf2 family helicase n=1 Tax=Trichoderma arundinaceum TaxID=490622 RepID=A0A395P081_TRIAR|nr:snf2 family helicase [Trichoderma arundinaceum]
MTQVLSLAPRGRHMELTPYGRMVRDEERSRTETAFGDSLHNSSSPIVETIMRRPPAPLGTPNANHDILDYPRLGNSTAAQADGSRDIICLCTPMPKIPRPRNAFILYRQHHQSQVTAENPRLSNPEISKIIGEKWKNEESNVKDDWKRLAEEEKQRHQHQYPNYRYQPRRGAKSQNWSGSAAAEEQGRCSRCNGRLMATPRTPSTPFATRIAPGLSNSEPQPRPPLHRLNTDIPRRTSIELSPINKLSMQSRLPVYRSPEGYEPASPEVKRRRTNGAGDYHLASGRLDSYSMTTPAEPPRLMLDGEQMAHIRTGSHPTLPDPASLPRSRSYPMPPPPRPGAWIDQGDGPRRSSIFDESLRLPPLQSAISPSPSWPSASDSRRTSLPLTGSPVRGRLSTRVMEIKEVEAEIMSISPKHKLSVLARLCQPAPPLSRDESSPRTRGVFLSVEGPVPSLLQEVGSAVERSLASHASARIKVWPSHGDGLPAGADRITRSEDRLSSCLQTVLSWRETSHEILDYVTGVNASGRWEGGRDRLPSYPGSPASKLPIALVKEGFSLTLSDSLACATFNADTGTPSDHWQWVAGLWQGTICPDLVIYVKPCDEDEIRTLGQVEFSRHMGLISVRVANNGGLDEATERRLSFEVMEWIRAASFCDAVPPNWRLE